MTGHVKVGGTWKSVASVNAKVAGAWKAVDSGFTKVAGAWKQFYSSAPPAAYELIQSTVLTTGASSVTFSSIPQDFKHLQVRFITKSSTSSSTRVLKLQMNGDTGNNYAAHVLEGGGSSVQSGAFTTGTINGIFASVSTGSAVANAWPAGVMDVLDYASTAKNTTISAFSGFAGASGEISQVYLRSGFWLNTAAVTSLNFSDSSNWLAGSRFSLYGIRG
jgi:hypothetical protein